MGRRDLGEKEGLVAEPEPVLPERRGKKTTWRGGGGGGKWGSTGNGKGRTSKLSLPRSTTEVLQGTGTENDAENPGDQDSLKPSRGDQQVGKHGEEGTGGERDTMHHSVEKEIGLRGTQ